MTTRSRSRFSRRWESWVPLLLAGTLVLGGFLASTPFARATPWTGAEPSPSNLLFYLHNASSGVMVGSQSYLNVLDTINDSQAPWTDTGAASVALHFNTAQFVVAPALAGPLAINGTTSAFVYMNQTGTALSGGSITLSLAQVSPNGSVSTIPQSGPTTPTSTGAILPGTVPYGVLIAGPTVNGYTLPAGDSLQVTLAISGNSGTGYGIWWGSVSNTRYVSTFSLPVSTYLNVARVSILNSTGQPVTVLPTSVTNTNVTIVGVVSDPLGAYDFESFSVDFSVTSSTGATVVAPTPMSPTPGLAAPTAPNGTYEIASFDYANLSTGVYHFTVNATDNTNHNLHGRDTLPTYFGRNAFGWATVSVGEPAIPVSVTVVDDHNVTLVGARVETRSAGVVVGSAATDGSGSATFNLAADAQYQFSVWWEGVAVGSFSANVTSSSSSFLLHAAVVYPTFHVVAAGGEALPYPLVTVVHPNGSVYPLIVASAAGTFGLRQVPAGNYTLTVIYDDSAVVSAKPFAVASDGPVTVSASNVFPLTVRTTASTGGALSGVLLTIANSSTGSTVASGITGADGTVTFLVPAGRYAVTGDWALNYYLTGLRQTTMTSVTVTAPVTTTLSFSQAYPPFTSTNEFYLILGYAIIIALLATLVALVVRRRRKTPPAAGARSSPSGGPPAESNDVNSPNDASGEVRGNPPPT
jgi:hypothetical protein